MLRDSGGTDGLNRMLVKCYEPETVLLALRHLRAVAERAARDGGRPTKRVAAVADCFPSVVALLRPELAHLEVAQAAADTIAAFAALPLRCTAVGAVFGSAACIERLAAVRHAQQLLALTSASPSPAAPAVQVAAAAPAASAGGASFVRMEPTSDSVERLVRMSRPAAAGSPAAEQHEEFMHRTYIDLAYNTRKSLVTSWKHWIEFVNGEQPAAAEGYLAHPPERLERFQAWVGSRFRGSTSSYAKRAPKHARYAILKLRSMQVLGGHVAGIDGAAAAAAAAAAPVPPVPAAPLPPVSAPPPALAGAASLLVEDAEGVESLFSFSHPAGGDQAGEDARHVLALAKYAALASNFRKTLCTGLKHWIVFVNRSAGTAASDYLAHPLDRVASFLAWVLERSVARNSADPHGSVRNARKAMAWLRFLQRWTPNAGDISTDDGVAAVLRSARTKKLELRAARSA